MAYLIGGNFREYPRIWTKGWTPLQQQQLTQDFAERAATIETKVSALAAVRKARPHTPPNDVLTFTENAPAAGIWAPDWSVGPGHALASAQGCCGWTRTLAQRVSCWGSHGFDHQLVRHGRADCGCAAGRPDVGCERRCSIVPWALSQGSVTGEEEPLPFLFFSRVSKIGNVSLYLSEPKFRLPFLEILKQCWNVRSQCWFYCMSPIFAGWTSVAANGFLRKELGIVRPNTKTSTKTAERAERVVPIFQLFLLPTWDIILSISNSNYKILTIEPLHLLNN